MFGGACEKVKADDFGAVRFMKLSELKALGEQATSAPWRGRYEVYGKGASVWGPVPDVITGSMQIAVTGWAEFDTSNATLIAAMRNHWDAMLKVADKARIALVISSTSNMLAIKEALAELEKVK